MYMFEFYYLEMKSLDDCLRPSVLLKYHFKALTGHQRLSSDIEDIVLISGMNMSPGINWTRNKRLVLGKESRVRYKTDPVRLETEKTRLDRECLEATPASSRRCRYA